MTLAWTPSNRTAQRIGNSLLKAYRAGQLGQEWPPSGETNCVLACTHSRLTPGTRAVLGRLWLKFGAESHIGDRATPEQRGEMEAALKAVA